jgi:predicted nucleic acid-binding protein
MPGTYTLDTSIFLSAFNPYDAGYEECHRLLGRLQEGATPIVVPAHLLSEVAAVISRGRQDGALASAFADALSRLPHLIWVPVDMALAQQASALAAQHRLRGSDAVFAAVAVRFGSTLVTLDREQRERVSDALPTLYPAEALDRH